MLCLLIVEPLRAFLAHGYERVFILLLDHPIVDHIGNEDCSLLVDLCLFIGYLELGLHLF